MRRGGARMPADLQHCKQHGALASGSGGNGMAEMERQPSKQLHMNCSHGRHM